MSHRLVNPKFEKGALFFSGTPCISLTWCFMQYLKDICHIQSIKVTITPTELMQKAPKSVQLLRENISHKQTLTKKLAMKIFVFLSRFLYAKISFKVFRQFTQEPQIFQHKNSICFTLVSMEYKKST